MNQSTKAGLAELIGTFMLVFLGAGAGALAGMNGAGILGVALAHGMGLVVIIYTWGWVSGAHVNPAVTLAAWITGKVQFGTVITYVVAQILGGVLAAAVLSYLIGTGTGLGQTTGVLTPTAKNVETYNAAKAELDKADPAEAKDKLAKLMEPSAVKVIIVEAILTFFLVCSVFSNGIAGKNGNGRRFGDCDDVNCGHSVRWIFNWCEHEPGPDVWSRCCCWRFELFLDVYCWSSGGCHYCRTAL